MILIELFSKTYKIVKDNLVLVQPLLIFLMLLGFILPSNTRIINIAIIFPILGLYCAFSAGWFSMFHKSLQHALNDNLTREEKAVKSLSLFKEFFPGVGKYFLKVTLGIVLYILLLIIILNVLGIIGNHFIGYPEAIKQLEATKAPIDISKFIDILNKMSEADKMKLWLRGILNIASLGLFSYLTMFWAQAVISEDKNLLSAYFESLKTVIKKPLTTFIIFISYCISMVMIVGILGIASSNIITQLLAIILFTLTLVYFTMMTFLYFERYRKNHSSGWADSFR